MAAMAADGVRRALAFVTSAYSSYSGLPAVPREPVRRGAHVPGAPEVDKVRPYFDHPGFVEPFVDATVEALAELPYDLRRVRAWCSRRTRSRWRRLTVSGRLDRARAARTSRSTAPPPTLVAGPGRCRRPGRSCEWDLVYQSRSGPPAQPWLEPDVGEHLEQLAARGRPGCGGRADRVRLRPPRGGVRPRHARPPDAPTRSGCRWCVRRHPAPTHGSSRWWSTSCASGSRADRSPTGRRCRRWGCGRTSASAGAAPTRAVRGRRWPARTRL